MTYEFPIVFHSQGVPLVGRILRKTDSLYERQPGVIAIGSWLTVKEQMATTYARRFADLGYTAFVFDYAGFGESRGEPRRAEIPARKVGDIRAAAEFLRTLSFVDADRIGCVAVCASAQYALDSLAHGAPVKSFASVAGWYHDPASVAPFYGGDAGMTLRLDRARAAMDRYVRTGDVTIVPAYKEGDDRAGMSFKLDYYALESRGAVPQWSNEMAEMSWLYWLSYDGRSSAPRVSTPSIFVHADGCVFPEHVKQIHASVKGQKALAWGDGAQTDFYDQPQSVDMAVDAVRDWFDRTL
jgi:fermentation-respiration switch protein FrsA (DUF1100 family)